MLQYIIFLNKANKFLTSKFNKTCADYYNGTINKTSLDKSSLTMWTVFRFSNAFDTVNHEILLSKLNYFGMRGI